MQYEAYVDYALNYALNYAHFDNCDNNGRLVKKLINRHGEWKTIKLTIKKEKLHKKGIKLKKGTSSNESKEMKNLKFGNQRIWFGFNGKVE